MKQFLGLLKGPIILAALALAGCGETAAFTPAPQVVTKEVKIPVAVPCAVHVAAPAFPDTDQALTATPEPGDMLDLLAAGRFVRQAYVNELEAALRGCGGVVAR